MTYDEFVGQVQQRARLKSLGDAVTAIHATLETLAERLTDDEARDLASQLPREIAVYILGSVLVEPDRMSLNEFFDRITWREQVERSEAFDHARAVLAVVGEAVAPGETNDALSPLPEDFRALILSGGHQGEFRKAA